MAVPTGTGKKRESTQNNRENELMKKRLRSKGQTFEIDPPEAPGRVASALFSVLNWLTAEDDSYDLEENGEEVLEVSMDATNSFSSLKKVRIEGRDFYSTYSLAYMQTWMLTESHNQIRRRHMYRCKHAFGELDYSGPVWTETDDPDAPDYT